MHFKLFSGMEITGHKRKDGAPFFIMGKRLSLVFGAVESLGGERELNFPYETVSIRKVIKC